jgi:hypothetical protein
MVKKVLIFTSETFKEKLILPQTTHICLQGLDDKMLA